MLIVDIILFCDLWLCVDLFFYFLNDLILSNDDGKVDYLYG